MNQGLTTMIIIFSTLLILIIPTQLTNAQDEQPYDEDPTSSNFKPSLYIVVAVLSFMFSSTFLLLLYAKYCYQPPTAIHSVNPHHNEPMFGSSTRFSGLEKTVVESLPLFSFSALKGSKQGLQCSVCLAEFQDIEILRLLPKCKHCFHIKCIDQWLEIHSTCPLCRHKISVEDISMIISSSLSVRTDFGSSSRLELLVERDNDHDHGHENCHNGSSKWSIGDSFRRIFRTKQGRVLQGFKHKIVMSDVVFKNRWSNVTSSDLLFLNSEMIGAMSSNRFCSVDDKVINGWHSDSSSRFDDCRQMSLITGDRRSMSEITALSRFKDMNNMKNEIRQGLKEQEISTNDDVNEDTKKRKIWFSIAKRTVEWFVNREKSKIRSQQSQNTEQILCV